MIDVIVVGAGPAGNNVAYRLASLGYNVTVVDSRQRIGDKLCSGIVGRECVRQYPLDQSLVYRDVRLAKAVAPGGETVDFARKDIQAHVIDRVAYVAAFADKARCAGAAYVLGTRVIEVTADAECATVRLSGGSKGSTLRARALVLANGFGSGLTRQMGLGRVADFATGVQAEVLSPGVGDMHVFFGRHVAPDFFAWLVPTAPGKALVGLLSRHNGLLYLKSLIQKLQAEKSVSEVTGGPARWGIPLRPLGRTFGDRLLVVGDAAGQVKPTTGGGIFYALLASEIAADTLHKALRMNDLSASQLRNYEREWKRMLAREMETGYSARQAFESLKDNQIDFLMHAIASNGIHRYLVNSSAVTFDWHSSVITKVLSHPLFGKALAFANPILSTLAPNSKGASDSRYISQQVDFE